MSRTALRKQTNYSQFRKKNSLSKTNLHRSMINIEDSLRLVVNQKTQELSCIQSQLQNIVRNRSLSNNLTPRSMIQQSSKLVIEKKPQSQLPKIRRNSFHSLTQVDTQNKGVRSLICENLNLTFQTIQQSQVHSEQDNGQYDIKQQAHNKISAKIQKECEESSISDKRQNLLNQGPSKQRDNVKIAISQLEDMQKKLESVKNAKKGGLKQKKVNKVQLPLTSALKSDRKLYKTTSQASFLTQHTKKKAQQTLRQKQNTAKPMLKKVLGKQVLKSTSSSQSPSSGDLIPTKMVNAEQKQKLLKEFDRLKQLIESTEICYNNLQTIRSMIKNIGGLIN